MQPDQAREQFDPYVDGHMEPREKLAFEELLSRDVELKREFEAYRGTIGLLRGLPAERPPDHFTDLVKLRLRRRSRGRPFRDRLRHSLVVETACCVLIVAIVATVSMFTEEAPEKTTPSAVLHFALERRDQTYLEAFGRVETVESTPSGLVAHLLIDPAREPALREALKKSGRLQLLPLSPQHVDGKLRVRVQVPKPE